MVIRAKTAKKDFVFRLVNPPKNHINEGMVTLGVHLTRRQSLFLNVRDFCARCKVSRNWLKLTMSIYYLLCEARPVTESSAMPRCTTKSHNSWKLLASHLASYALDANPEISSPTSHEWLIRDGQVDINWTSLPPAPEALLELVLCGRTTDCTTGHCRCKRNGVPCVELGSLSMQRF